MYLQKNCINRWLCHHLVPLHVWLSHVNLPQQMNLDLMRETHHQRLRSIDQYSRRPSWCRNCHYLLGKRLCHDARMLPIHWYQCQALHRYRILLSRCGWYHLPLEPKARLYLLNQTHPPQTLWQKRCRKRQVRPVEIQHPHRYGHSQGHRKGCYQCLIGPIRPGLQHRHPHQLQCCLNHLLKIHYFANQWKCYCYQSYYQKYRKTPCGPWQYYYPHHLQKIQQWYPNQCFENLLR